MSKVEEAVKALEEAFLRAVPADKKKRMREDEWVISLGNFHEEARKIRRQHSLGIFSRARVAYILQQRLLAAGFRADAVRKVVFSLVLNSFITG